MCFACPKVPQMRTTKDNYNVYTAKPFPHQGHTTVDGHPNTRYVTISGLSRCPPLYDIDTLQQYRFRTGFFTLKTCRSLRPIPWRWPRRPRNVWWRHASARTSIQPRVTVSSDSPHLDTHNPLWKGLHCESPKRLPAEVHQILPQVFGAPAFKIKNQLLQP